MKLIISFLNFKIMRPPAKVYYTNKAKNKVATIELNIIKENIDDDYGFGKEFLRVEYNYSMTEKIATDTSEYGEYEMVMEILETWTQISYEEYINISSENGFLHPLDKHKIIDYKAKYEKCIETIKKVDAGIISFYDL